MSVHRFLYEVALLSDTCCGSGTGNGSDVDVTASFDERGLPVIPAKRLRGLLRENALLLCEEADTPYGREDVLSLFGDSGRTSRLTVDNAEPEHAEEIRAALAGLKKYSPNEVKAVFTVKRAQTAVSRESGTADKGSLRVTEVVKKGEKFFCGVSVKNPAAHDAAIIEDAFAVLRGIGMDRNRGLGEVACRKVSDSLREEAAVAGAYEKREGLYRLPYTLTLKNDLLLMLNSPMRNPDFIPGATLQGAFAGVFSGQPYFDGMFFDDLKFGNAYLSDGVIACRPAPRSFVAVKNVPGEVFDLAAGYRRQDDQQYVSVGGYGRVEGGSFLRLSVETGTDYHINKGRSNEAAETFYNARRINKGQVFMGAVYGSESALALLRNAGVEELRLGASVSSQYGLCGISFGGIAPVETRAARKGETLILRLLSDAVVLDAYGNQTTRFKDLIDGLCGEGAFSLCRAEDGTQMAYAATGFVSGFNAKWGLPRQQYRTVAKGSALTLRAERDIEALPLFTGIANAEGCGLLAWEPADGPCRFAVKKPEPPAAAPVEHSAAARVVAAMECGRTDRKVRLEALLAANDLHDNNLSGSAAMRMMTLYQALRLKGAVTPDGFKKEAEDNFSKNRALKALAVKMTDRFLLQEPVFPQDRFELFLRTFIGRYKEIRQTERTAGELKGGEGNE
ncbi:MAG: hypothetical protein IJK98_07860 [Clostridia bacterium]|nr:hypothetical protein [Clostridia bacterium]